MASNPSSTSAIYELPCDRRKYFKVDFTVSTPNGTSVPTRQSASLGFSHHTTSHDACAGSKGDQTVRRTGLRKPLGRRVRGTWVLKPWN